MEIESENLSWFLNWKKDQILTHITSIILNFQSTEQLKLRSLRQLSSFLKLIGGNLDFVQFNTIFKILVKVSVLYRENQNFTREVLKCVTLLAITLPLDDLTEQIMVNVEKDSSVDSLVSLATTLNLYECLTRENKSTIKNPRKMIENILITFSKLESRFYENPLQLTSNSFLILMNIANKGLKVDFDLTISRLLCKVLMVLKTSFSESQIFSSNDFNLLIEKFSQMCSKPKQDFLATTIGLFFDDVWKNKEYEMWNEYSFVRKQFIGCVCNFREVALLSFDKVIVVLQKCCSFDNDFTTRFEALEALHSLSDVEKQNSLKSVFFDQIEAIFLNVIRVSMTWKVGKPNNKIRKAAVFCGIQIIKNQLVDDKQLSDLLSQMIPSIKSCMSDDWCPDLRFAVLEFCKLIFQQIQNLLKDNDIRDIYASILERLDDAQDDIRIKSVEVFEFLLLSDNCHFSSGILEYILKAFFIHFDDSNDKLQEQIFSTLINVREKIGMNILLDTALSNVGRFRYPGNCARLIEILQKNGH